MSIKNVVERLQLQLLLNGYSVPLTGKIENETRNAIKKYQKSKGWKETGLIDTKLLGSLGIYLE